MKKLFAGFLPVYKLSALTGFKVFFYIYSNKEEEGITLAERWNQGPYIKVEGCIGV